MQLMTAEELLMRPDSHGRSELVDGLLWETPFASFVAGVAGQRLAIELADRVSPNQLGTLTLAGTGFYLASNPDTVLAPDVGFVAKSRLPADISTLRGFFPGAPDFAVEVVLSGDTYEEVEDKVGRYLNAGTRLVWIVRPKQRRVEVHRADGTSQLLSQTETLDGESVVPGFALPGADIFD